MRGNNNNTDRRKTGIAGKYYSRKGCIRFRLSFLVNCDENDELQCFQLGNVYGVIIIIMSNNGIAI